MTRRERNREPSKSTQPDRQRRPTKGHSPLRCQSVWRPRAAGQDLRTGNRARTVTPGPVTIVGEPERGPLGAGSFFRWKLRQAGIDQARGTGDPTPIQEGVAERRPQSGREIAAERHSHLGNHGQLVTLVKPDVGLLRQQAAGEDGTARIGNRRRRRAVDDHAGVGVSQVEFHLRLQEPAAELLLVHDPQLHPVEAIGGVEQVDNLLGGSRDDDSLRGGPAEALAEPEAFVELRIAPTEQEIRPPAGLGMKIAPEQNLHGLKLARHAGVGRAVKEIRVGDEHGSLGARLRVEIRPGKDRHLRAGGGAARRLPPHPEVTRLDAVALDGIEPIAERQPLAGTGVRVDGRVAEEDSRAGLAKHSGCIRGRARRACRQHRRQLAPLGPPQQVLAAKPEAIAKRRPAWFIRSTPGGRTAGGGAVGGGAAGVAAIGRDGCGHSAASIAGRRSAANLGGNRQARRPDREGDRGDPHVCGKSGARGVTTATRGGRCTIHAIPSSFAGSPLCAGRPKILDLCRR